jgi:tol-pal system protein YbgF
MTKPTPTRAALMLVLLLVWMTPARPVAADREHQQIIADIRMLQEQAQQLQALLNGLGDALKAMNARIDDQTALERKAFADNKVQIDGIASDFRVVREKVDETNVRLGSLSQELESMRDALPQPGSAPPPQVPTTSDAAPLPDGGAPAPAPPPAVAAGPAPAGISPERLWTTSYGDYSSGNYSLAISGLESYLKYFPRGSHAAEAQLLIGQAYEQDKKLEDAITAYDRVISNYPNSPEQVASAYYKRGSVQQTLGQTDRARQSYETILKELPTTSSAILAKQRLEGLKAPAR